MFYLPSVYESDTHLTSFYLTSKGEWRGVRHDKSKPPPLFACMFINCLSTPCARTWPYINKQLSQFAPTCGALAVFYFRHLSDKPRLKKVYFRAYILKIECGQYFWRRSSLVNKIRRVFGFASKIRVFSGGKRAARFCT